jgi:PP-loop superfamily ATP-utilizing enzyme
MWSVCLAAASFPYQAAAQKLHASKVHMSFYGIMVSVFVLCLACQPLGQNARAATVQTQACYERHRKEQWEQWLVVS